MAAPTPSWALLAVEFLTFFFSLSLSLARRAADWDIVLCFERVNGRGAANALGLMNPLRMGEEASRWRMMYWFDSSGKILW